MDFFAKINAEWDLTLHKKDLANAQALYNKGVLNEKTFASIQQELLAKIQQDRLKVLETHRPMEGEVEEL